MTVTRIAVTQNHKMGAENSHENIGIFISTKIYSEILNLIYHVHLGKSMRGCLASSSNQFLLHQTLLLLFCGWFDV